MNDKPKLPPNFKDTVEDTRDLINSLITRVAGVAGDAGKRWLDGFERDDVQAVSKEIGNQLDEYVLQVWEVAEKNVKPSKDGGTNG